MLISGETNRVSSQASDFINVYLQEMSFVEMAFSSGYGFVSSQKLDISSWWSIFLDKGILGFIILLVAFATMMPSRWYLNRVVVAFLVVFFMAFLQRLVFYRFFTF